MMRTRVIVLLAVCSNVAVAGIIRRNDVRVLHHNAARFLNQTNTASIPADIPTLTPLPVSSSLIPSTVASPETSILAATSSTIPTVTSLTSEVTPSVKAPTDLLAKSTPTPASSTSVPVSTTEPRGTTARHSEGGSPATSVNTEATVMQPVETLSRLFNLAESSSNGPSDPSSAQSFSILSSTRSNAFLSTISDALSASSIQQNAATSSSSVVGGEFSVFVSTLTAARTTDASHPTSFSTGPVPISSTSAFSQASSPVVVPVPVSTGPVQVLGLGGDTEDEFAPVTLDKSLSAPTGTAIYPTAGGGNNAMAASFNNVYKTLNEDSPCNPGDPSQAYACIEGEIAECQSDQTYVLKSCPRGQSCYALPKPSGSSGVVVQCAVPSDAYSILAGSASATAVPTPIVSQSAQTIQAEGFSTQPTYSVSAQISVQPTTSSSLVQASSLSQIIETPPSAQAVIAATSQAKDSDQVRSSAIPTSTTSTPVQSVFQAQSQILSSPSPATAKAQQAQDSGRLQNPTESDTSQSLPSTTAEVLSVPKALFAVVTGTEGNQASQTRPGIAQSSAASPQANPDSLQPIKANVIITSTSSADNGGTTLAPEGVPVNEKLAVGNGQATVTVTVTVTTTERPAPVTITAS